MRTYCLFNCIIISGHRSQKEIRYWKECKAISLEQQSQATTHSQAKGNQVFQEKYTHSHS